MVKPGKILASGGRPIALLACALHLLLLIAPSQSLYEDQIGKFDWKRTQIGAIRQAAFHGAAGERIIAATEHNVLAALHTKTGEIAWRKLLERNERGSIQFLHVPQSVASELAASGSSPDDDNADYDQDTVITVSGSTTALVRGWDAQTGHAEWEWTLTPNQLPTAAAPHRWLLAGDQLYHLVLVWGAHVESTAYAVRTGQPIGQTTARISAPWSAAGDERCVLTQTQLVCATEKEVISLALTTAGNEVRRQPLLEGAGRGVGRLRQLEGAADTVVFGGQVYAVGAKKQQLAQGAKVNEEAAIYAASFGDEVLAVEASCQSGNLQITSTNLRTNQRPAAIEATLEHHTHSAEVRVADVLCKLKSGAGVPVCRLLLTTGDGAVLLVQQGRTKWTREEALAHIVAVEMIDLQLSDAEGSIETELKSKDGDVLAALARRLTSQIAHLRNTALAALGLGATPSASQAAGLVRDAFGLHKMLVVLTASGKLFGIDNQSGATHWQRVLPAFSGFGADQPMQILVQRSAGHFPLSAQCTVLGRDRQTGRGLLYQFDPITGRAVDGGKTMPADGVWRLPYAVRQATLVAHVRPGDFIRALLLLDKQGGAHVFPADAAAQADGMYVYAADTETSVISGWRVRHLSGGKQQQQQQLEAQALWQVNVGGAGGQHRIVRVAGKKGGERVHSQGRVFNDRSVLYKYINPNLVAVATLGPDAIHKSILNIHLLDVVSGGIVYSMSHRRVRTPLHIVHSENWLVYTYYNEKVRRTECTTVELYEGKSQANGTVWSSLDAPQLPLVERQSYILPANVVALRETITERGITNKHVLVALATGSVLEMPWALLDPRRPVLLPNQPREEGIIPYVPELPLPSENVINYNQSVAAVRAIAAAPSGLESTCLVMAYGLDIFVTRVAPSKTFDLLKEDFDYMLIMLVLVGLSAASVVVRQLSARKAVKQAWK